MIFRLISFLIILLSSLEARALEACPAHEANPLTLRITKGAVENNLEITIVAFGSSSTQGWHASDVAHSYPALLQQELNTALPRSQIAVLNRGIGGQDAAEMIPRLERDVLDAHPTLVIWQVGANGAMRRANPEEFERLVINGVQRLQRAKVDVVLMNNQRAPAILASPEHLRIDQALAEAARQTGAGLFDRGALMDEWKHEGHPYSEFVSDDGLHHNDRGYRCLASALADDILEGLAQPIATVRSASARH